MKTKTVAETVYKKELETPIAESQERLNKAVIARAEAWRVHHKVEREYEALERKYVELTKILEAAKEEEQSAISFLVDSIAVQNSKN